MRVFDGRSLALLRSFFAYDQGFMGGVNVAAGDVNGDGKADIVTGAGPGAQPSVKVFNGANNTVLRSFLAIDESFRGGEFPSPLGKRMEIVRQTSLWAQGPVARPM